MKNELTIQHLAPYLPYGLKVKYKDCIYDKTHIATLSGVSNDAVETTYKRRFKGCSGDYISLKGRNNITQLNFMPILRPLSDLTKEIEHNGERFVPIDKLANIWGNGNCIPSVRQSEWYCKEFYSKDGLTCNFYDHYPYVEILNEYRFTKKLFEWHFDVFGLIEQGSAIDINTIQK